MVFGHVMGYGYLLLFRRGGYKLLLFMVRKEVEQRRLDSVFLFRKKEGGTTDMLRCKGRLLNIPEKEIQKI